MVKLIDGHQIFDRLFKIYLEAFPPTERKNEDELKRLMHINHFHFEGIEYEGKLCGLVGYWVLGDFIYIEYFATDATFRGAGIGSKFLTLFHEMFHTKEIILEVENPKDELQERRVRFYERNAFHFYPETFLQPQIFEKKEEVVLNIMSSKPINDKQHFQKIIQTLFENVYSQKSEPSS